MTKWIITDKNGCEIDTMVLNNMIKMASVLARNGEPFSVRVVEVE